MADVSKLEILVLYFLDVITESSKSYSVDQHGLHGDLRSDLMSMFNGDHVLHYFSRLFDGKGTSLLFSGDEGVNYCMGLPVTLLEETIKVTVCYD